MAVPTVRGTLPTIEALFCVGVLEAEKAGASGAWGLFCQFLLPDNFTAGPPFRQAAVATLAPPMVLRVSAPTAFSHGKCESSPCQGFRPSYVGL